MFNACVTKLLEERPSYSLHEVLRLQSSLLNYALQVGGWVRAYAVLRTSPTRTTDNPNRLIDQTLMHSLVHKRTVLPRQPGLRQPLPRAVRGRAGQALGGGE